MHIDDKIVNELLDGKVIVNHGYHIKKDSHTPEFDVENVEKIVTRKVEGFPLSTWTRDDFYAYKNYLNEVGNNIVPTENLSLACFRKKGLTTQDPSVFESHFYQYDLVIPLIKDNEGRYYDAKFLKEIEIQNNIYMPPRTEEFLKKLGYQIDDYKFIFTDDVKVVEEREKMKPFEYAFRLKGRTVDIGTEEYNEMIDSINLGYISIADFYKLTHHIQTKSQEKVAETTNQNRIREARNFINNLGKGGM